MSHDIYTNESCHVHEWVISHTWMNHDTWFLKVMEAKVTHTDYIHTRTYTHTHSNESHHSPRSTNHFSSNLVWVCQSHMHTHAYSKNRTRQSWREWFHCRFQMISLSIPNDFIVDSNYRNSHYEVVVDPMMILLLIPSWYTMEIILIIWYWGFVAKTLRTPNFNFCHLR